MNRYLRPKFIFGVTLATVIAGGLWIGPFYALYHLLQPNNFWQRLSFVVVGGLPFCGMAFVCFMFWLWIGSKFE